MNHRERVIAAINHQEPDRVPVDLGGMRSATIIGLPDARLKEHLGITEGEVYVFDPYLQLAYVEEPLRQRFGCDVVLLNENLLGGWQAYHLPVGKPAKTCADFRTEPDVSGGEYSLDEQGRRTWYRPPGGYYFDALKPKVSVFLHSCGAIFDLIPGLIDAGLDILNPVQISARGMAARAAEKRVWRAAVPVGRRLRYPARAAVWHAGKGVRAHLAQRGSIQTRRRLRLQPGAQHPGQRAAGKCRGHVRGRSRRRKVLIILALPSGSAPACRRT